MATTKRSRATRAAPRRRGPVTLVVDVGGSGVKAALLDARARMLGERMRIETPHDLDPASLVQLLTDLAATLRERVGPFDRVTIGINGIVHRGRLLSVPVTEDPAFRHFDLAGKLRRKLGCPTRVLNDAELHGLGFIRGRGVEVVITLGTGLGTALFVDGDPGPHLQFTPSPGNDDRVGGDYGDLALEALGRKKWRRRVCRLIDELRLLTNFDRLYIGGGNAEVVKLDEEHTDVVIGDNSAAMVGGVRVWEWDVD